MTILGIDYGTKRIGLATGDSGSSLVFPLRTIERKEGLDAVAAVLEAARAESAGRVVVGVPRRMTGRGGAAGETERQALAFAESLLAGAVKLGMTVEVDTEDERMTSALADRWQEMSGGKKGKFDRDAAAAAAILETYIERNFGKG
jgi:putative Holliday junction resolvase